MSASEIEKTVWSYKNVVDDDLSNKNLEIILNFYDREKFELNINKFSSCFDIDLDTFLDNSKVKKDEQENKNDNIENDKNIQKGIPDDVFQSGKLFYFFIFLDYHHSLILGSYVEDKNKIALTIEKVFTNQKNYFSEDKKEINLKKENNEIKILGDSVLDEFLKDEKNVILTQIKQIKN